MGRGRREAGRWAIAAPAGLAANLLLIGLLSLVERAAPPVEPPSMIVELDRTEEGEPPRSASKPSARAASSPASPPAPPPRGEAEEAATPGKAAGASSAGQAGPAAPRIDPAWRVDPRAVDRWKLTEGNPDFRWGRYHRACKGLSSEHLTDEEKDRCWGGFAAKAPPTQLGPSGRAPRPPSRFDAQARQQEACRGYRGSVTPGSKSSSVLGFGGVADPPRLRDGGC
jgi:hypothetical protein